MADYLGTTLFTVSRIMNEFKVEGIVDDDDLLMMAASDRMGIVGLAMLQRAGPAADCVVDLARAEHGADGLVAGT